MKKDYLFFNYFDALFDELFDNSYESIFNDIKSCDMLCDECIDNKYKEECKKNQETTPTIAERLKEVSKSKNNNKNLENALNHVKDAVTDAIAGDFTTNAKYAELIPNKGIQFVNDPIICSIIDSDKRFEFHDRVLDEFGFKAFLVQNKEVNGKKTVTAELYY